MLLADRLKLIKLDSMLKIEVLVLFRRTQPMITKWLLPTRWGLSATRIGYKLVLVSS